MKRLTIYCWIACALLVASAAGAQSTHPRLVFDRAVHAFDTIPEGGGLVGTSFTFTNTHSDTIAITTTFKQCGCTQPTVTQAPLAPGTQGTLRVSYDPNGRPGPFTKTVGLTGPGLDTVYQVTITGYVQPHRLPILSGPLRLSGTQFALGTQLHTARTQQAITVLNVDSLPLHFLMDSVALPTGLRLDGPRALAPGKEGTLTLAWDVAASGWWNYHYTLVDLPMQRDTALLPLRLLMTGTVKEDFKPMEALGAGGAPAAALGATSLDLGRLDSGAVATGQPITGQFVLANTGGSPLHIRQLKSSCRCLQVEAELLEVAPGAETVLRVRYTPPPNAHGAQRQLLALMLNDPQQPQWRLEVLAQLPEAPTAEAPSGATPHHAPNGLNEPNGSGD